MNRFIIVHDKDRQRLARVGRYESYEAITKISSEGPFTLATLANDNSVPHLVPDNFLYLYDEDNTIVATGVIARAPELRGNVVVSKAFTEPYLLSKFFTPTQYGDYLSNMLAKDALERLLAGGFGTIRYKFQSQLDRALALGATLEPVVNVVSSPVEYGLLQLENATETELHSSGSCVLIFDSKEIKDFTFWDSCRFFLTTQDKGQVGFQCQPLNSLAGYSPNNWLPNTQSEYANGTVLGDIPLSPETKGYDFFDQRLTQRYMAIRFNFITTDVDTPDNPDNPTQHGINPAVLSVDITGRTKNGISFDASKFPDGERVSNVTANHGNVLEVCKVICDQGGLEFDVVVGEFILAEQIGRDLTNEFHLTTGRA